MIKEFEFYHGAALVRLLYGADQEVVIESFPSESNASYIINKNIGLYIKHSAKRMSPWRFSFSQEHRDEILKMKKMLDKVFLLLVCGEDGIVSLSFDEFKKIVNETNGLVEWVSVVRNKNAEYAVEGSDGFLGYKISKKEFPGKLFERNTNIENSVVESRG
ncbi:MAG: hypothetical protein PHE24_04235 [Patescibacteria group bacterium]|nr:hypothetical protein [Patescibacteria group bacterium]